MPRVWTDTIDAHRRAVSEAILDTTAALVAAQGLRAVTMSAIAEGAGIGRATLYKYFPDVETILGAWHERQVAGHLAQLSALRAGPGDALGRLEAVLRAYALVAHKQTGGELAALLHRGKHVNRAERELRRLVGELVAEGAQAGAIRDDVPADELAGYCLHALSAAAALPSKRAVERLVGVTLAGLRPGATPA